MSQVLISGLVSTNQVNRWSARNIRPVNSSWSLSYIYGGRFGTKRLLKILWNTYLHIRVPEKKNLIPWSSGFWLLHTRRKKKSHRLIFVFCLYILKYVDNNPILSSFLKVVCTSVTSVRKSAQVRTIPSAEYSQTSLGGHSECMHRHTFLQSQIVQRLGKVLRSYLQMSVWNWTLQCYYYWYVRKIEGTNHVI